MKILYYYSKLNIGGAERSTVRLLNKMVQMGHSVSLLLRWNGGSLEGELDSRIRVVYLKQGNPDMPGFKRYPHMFFETVKMQYVLKELQKEEFDLAISGLFGYNPSILFKSIKAKKYFQMLRNDVSKTGNYGKTRQYMEQYGNQFDAYIGVSKFTTDSFKGCYPDLSDKAYTIYNILPEVDPKIVRDYPKEFKGNEDIIKILTVCRMADEAKGLFRMESVCKKLEKEFQHRFKWFVVGEGPDKEELNNKIIQDGLQDTMILCPGTKDPFKYYKHCDLVAVLSYYEGLCGVVNESKMMKKPVIATEFSGIYEQITSGINGIVVENEEDAIFRGLQELLNSPEHMRQMSINGLPEKLLDNEAKVFEFEKIYREC